MDLHDVKIVELSAIIEIGLPFEKADGYKTERGLQNFLNRLAFFVAQNVPSLGETKLIHHGNWTHDDFIVINNFGYSCNWNRQKSKTHRVFRGFGLTLFAVRRANERDQNFFGTYTYDVEGYPVEITVSGQTVSQTNINSPKKDQVVFRKFREMA